MGSGFFVCLLEFHLILFSQLPDSGHLATDNYGQQTEQTYERKIMNLRFAINQAEAFRRGINAPKSTVTIDVNPKEISEENRHLIANRMDGIDVCQLDPEYPGWKVRNTGLWGNGSDDGKWVLVLAIEPTLEGLIKAVKADEAAFVSKSKAINDKHEKPRQAAAA